MKNYPARRVISTNCKVNVGLIMGDEYMRFCLWDYVTCYVVVALVSYILSGDL